jgi:lipid-binding SYLF domain-containing protein
MGMHIRKQCRVILVVVAVFLLGPSVLCGSLANADSALEATQLAEKARLTLESFAGDPQMQGFLDLAKRAKGIFIAPQMLKGAFVFGASGGSGLLLTRKELDGAWAGPAFYTIGEASFGLQIGGQASEVLLLAMTDRGVSAFLGNSVKLGANLGMAAGPVGAGAAAATANLSADIVSFSRSKGLYGGISMDGAVVATRDAWNKAYYGEAVSPADILTSRTASNPEARKLIETVARVAGGK